MRCDQEMPCSTCVRIRNNGCVYESQSMLSNQPMSQTRTTELRPAPQGLSSDRHLAPHQAPDSRDCLTQPRQEASLSTKDRQAEQQAYKMAHLQTLQTLRTAVSPASGTLPDSQIKQHNNHDDQKDAIRHIIYKSRVYGRSHWMNGVLEASHG